jgi:predicted nucleic acid-binding protein
MVSERTGFWDASALVPLCIHEKRTPQARSYLRGFRQVVWWGSFLEVYSAICRLHRATELSDLGKSSAVQRLKQISSTWREIIPDDQVRDLAVQSLDKYALRAADSLQLAASLVWCGEHSSKRTFICADQRLGQAASSAGFSVIQL